MEEGEYVTHFKIFEIFKYFVVEFWHTNDANAVACRQLVVHILYFQNLNAVE